MIAGCLKGFALGDRHLTWRRNWSYSLLTGATLIIIVGAHALPPSYRVLSIAAAGICSMTSCVVRLLGSRYWRGSWAYAMMCVVSTTGSFIMLPRLVRAFPIGRETQFLGDSAHQLVTLLAIIVLSFFMQVAFIGLLANRETRRRILAERRTARAAERARQMQIAQIESDHRSSERLAFLRMLTHEVRQPMNNAQAALQAISMQISSPKGEGIEGVIRRTQSVLDDIVLSLSNAITGATLIDRGAGANFKSIDVLTVCHLAILDAPPHEHQRIAFRHGEHELFLDCDPVLMRLCLRNLIDNAIKYSPRGSSVGFQVLIDDANFGIRFLVKNQLADPLSMQGNIFERGKRSVDKIHEGFGVGLFIARETAKLHFGTLTYYQSSPYDVTFDLFVPS